MTDPVIDQIDLATLTERLGLDPIEQGNVATFFEVPPEATFTERQVTHMIADWNAAH